MITPGLSIAIGVLLLGSVGRLPHQVRKAVSTAAAEVLQSFCKPGVPLPQSLPG